MPSHAALAPAQWRAISGAVAIPRAGASRIPVLAAASFATATQSFVFAGLLAELAADLDVTVAAAGQLGTAYALAFGVSAPLARVFV